MALEEFLKENVGTRWADRIALQESAVPAKRFVIPGGFAFPVLAGFDSGEIPGRIFTNALG